MRRVNVLSRNERIAFASLWTLTALSRFAAIARSPWDWDEVQFMRGVRAYDVSLHAPHPPGYPIYIALAKLLRPFAASDFRALQIIVVASGIFLFPVVFFLARELRFSTRTALLGATLTAFLPNVWFYGGTAMSDVPGLVLGLLACALLLRGRTISGAIILAISVGIRTQNVLLAIVPFILGPSTVRRRVAAIAVCALIVAVTYGSVAMTTPRYFETLHEQQEWIKSTDAIGAPGRPPLHELFVWYFVLPIDARKLFIPITLLAAVPIVLRRRPALLTFATFAPFAIFAYLMLSPEAIARYSIGYIVAYALLAIDALDGLKPVLHTAASIVLIAACAAWAWRPLQVVRTQVSPPFAATQWVLHHLPPHTRVYGGDPFEPFVRYYLGAYDTQSRDADWFIIDHDVLTRCMKFRYEYGRLWRVARQRNFVVNVVAKNQIPQFGAGWHPQEAGEAFSWRWMSRRADVTMPAFARPATLEMIGDLPSANGFITIRRTWPSDGLHATTVHITIDHPQHISGDWRDLGFRLRSLTWIPVIPSVSEESGRAVLQRPSAQAPRSRSG